MKSAYPSLLSADSAALRILTDAAQSARIVVFCGIPGSGKSLLVRELVKLSHAVRRRVTLMQWDVSRQAFELPGILERYPEVDGATHVMIRRAAGLWSRGAIEQWSRHNTSVQDLLVVEAPLVGGRWSELAHCLDDAAEPILRAPDTRYFVPTPSIAVRRVIEAARTNETAINRHARDAANAIPQLVDELWQQVAAAANRMQLANAPRSMEYEPAQYFALYAAVLKHRNVIRVPVEETVKAVDSPHAIGKTVAELIPEIHQVPTLLSVAEAEGVAQVTQQSQVWYET